MSTTNITVQKGRLKVYAGGTVYMPDNQEFELELFNSHSQTRMAKIAINGKMISTSGLVIKPGQRIFLERYLDEAKKFLFETYKIDASDSQAQQAAAQNGLIQVYWYDEYTNPSYTITTSSTNAPWFVGSGSTTNINTFYSNTTTGGGFGQKVNSLRSARLSSEKPIRKGRAGGSSASMDWMEQTKERGIDIPDLSEELAERETGRVEKGNYSDQKFKNYYGTFNSWITVTNTIRILPLSEKPIEAKDLLVHCTSCGTKQKKGWKHCPKCGNEYVQ